MERNSRRQLLWHGMFLFLLGLLSGFAGGGVRNPRMGLSAHIEGVMNGTFLLVLGAVWTEVRLPDRAKAVAWWSALYGAYVNWGVTMLAAVLGTAALTPLTAGAGGAPWQETLVTVGFMSVGLAMVLAAVLTLWGLGGRPSGQADATSR